MNSFIDILAFLRSNNKALRGVSVVGQITKEIPRPVTLQTSVQVPEDLKCVSVDIFSVDLSSHSGVLKSLNMQSTDNIYMATGSFACYVPKDTELNTWHNFTGTLRIATREITNMVALYNLRKQGNAWHIQATDTSPFTLSSIYWDKTSDQYRYLQSSLQKNCVDHPEILSSIAQCQSEMVTIGTAPQTPVKTSA